MPTLPDWAVQVLQVVTILALAPLVSGRVSVEHHGGTLEFGQIEEGRVAEHSGPGLAFLRWGSNVEQLLLFTIFVNVLVAPWGMAGTGDLGSVLLAIAMLFCKRCSSAPRSCGSRVAVVLGRRST